MNGNWQKEWSTAIKVRDLQNISLASFKNLHFKRDGEGRMLSKFGKSFLVCQSDITEDSGNIGTDTVYHSNTQLTQVVLFRPVHCVHPSRELGLAICHFSRLFTKGRLIKRSEKTHYSYAGVIRALTYNIQSIGILHPVLPLFEKVHHSFEVVDAVLSLHVHQDAVWGRLHRNMKEGIDTWMI